MMLETLPQTARYRRRCALGVLVIWAALGVAPVSAQTAADCADPQTQSMMTSCAARAYDAADAELNAAWGPAKAFADAIDKGAQLLAAQRAWLVYRDLACDAQASPFEGGSIQPMIRLGCLAGLTRERSVMLRDFNAY